MHPRSRPESRRQESLVLSTLLGLCDYSDYRLDRAHIFYVFDLRVLEYTQEESGSPIHRSSDLFWIAASYFLHFCDPTSSMMHPN